MGIDWDRRRTNIRILIAARGTNATTLARDCGLSPNTLTQFLKGTNSHLSAKSLGAILPSLGIQSAEDLDTDNVLSDPRSAIRRMLSQIPDTEIPSLLEELRSRFPNAEQ